MDRFSMPSFRRPSRIGQMGMARRQVNTTHPRSPSPASAHSKSTATNTLRELIACSLSRTGRYRVFLVLPWQSSRSALGTVDRESVPFYFQPAPGSNTFSPKCNSKPLSASVPIPVPFVFEVSLAYGSEDVIQVTYLGTTWATAGMKRTWTHLEGALSVVPQAQSIDVGSSRLWRRQLVDLPGNDVLLPAMAHVHAMRWMHA